MKATKLKAKRETLGFYKDKKGKTRPITRPFSQKRLTPITGYRVGYPSELDATKVIAFEVNELGNTHLLSEIASTLRCDPNLASITTAINRAFGPSANAIWLCTSPAHAKARYVSGEAFRVTLPAQALMVSDLGPDGQLWICRGTIAFQPSGPL